MGEPKGMKYTITYTSQASITNITPGKRPFVTGFFSAWRKLYYEHFKICDCYVLSLDPVCTRLP